MTLSAIGETPQSRWGDSSVANGETAVSTPLEQPLGLSLRVAPPLRSGARNANPTQATGSHSNGEFSRLSRLVAKVVFLGEHLTCGGAA